MIPVVWLSWHPEVPGRSYWDQAMLQDLFDGKLWTTPPWPRFEHIDIHGEPLPADLHGAVIVLPGRYHRDQVGRLNEEIAHLDWVHLIVTSDEESWFPWWDVAHPKLTLWVMTPRPEHAKAHPDRVGRWLGEGYQPGTPSIAAERPIELGRPLVWAFAGQITHPRRKELAHALQDRLSRRRDGKLLETSTFAGGMPLTEYLAWLGSARYAPAPSGPVTLDSFRLYEALEAGCVPIVETTNGKNETYGRQFWPMLFGLYGDGHPPLPMLAHWAQLDRTIEALDAEWPMIQVRMIAWWVGYKRQLAADLVDQLPALPANGADDQITVVVPTSPIDRHPSTDIIDETIDSIRERLPRAEILILCDGVRPEQEDYRDAYEVFLQRICWKALHHWTNVLPIVAHEHLHQSGLMKLAIEEVETPTLLFVEHDTPLIGEIPFADLVKPIISGEANLIRLHHEAGILEPHEHLMIDKEPIDVEGVPLLRTAQWSQRPHLASTAFYREILATYFGERSRTMIEDVMHGVADHHFRLYKRHGWEKFRLFMYAPDGDMKRSTHLDGRRRKDGELDPKFEDRWVFAYDGNTPEGAPNPERDETVE